MSFLSFPWASSLTDTHHKARSLSAPSSPLPPLVTASNSGETTAPSSPARLLLVPLPLAPHTPEGLRPRPSLDSLREELGISGEDSNGATEQHTQIANTNRPRAFLTEKKAKPGAFLPPAPSSSWSLPTNAQQLMVPSLLPRGQFLLSPPISTSSFYYVERPGHAVGANGAGGEEGGWGDVAISPHLMPGHARTAVGAAVVAMNGRTNGLVAEASSSQQADDASYSSITRATGYEGDQSVVPVEADHALPPILGEEDDAWYRHWEKHCMEQENNNINNNIHYEDEEEEHEEVELPYYPLDKDPIGLLPNSARNTPQRMRDSRHKSNKNINKITMSPISTHSSLVGSPSSLARPHAMARQQQPSTMMQARDAAVNQSLTSEAGLLPHDHHQLQHPTSRYDLAPVAKSATPGTDSSSSAYYGEVVLAHPSDQTHVSAMSHSIPEQPYHPQGHTMMGRTMMSSGGDVEEGEEVSHDDYISVQEDHQQHGHGLETRSMDGALRKQKGENQRRLREELVSAILERLQDNVQLVADVEAMDGEAETMADWYVRTPLDKEGLLMGFTQERRQRLEYLLSSILQEMNMAQPEEFYLSPTQVPGFSEIHSDLRDALYFCLLLVRMAVPQSEQKDRMAYPSQQGAWKLLPGLRSSLGIFLPESPERMRGGDTSVSTLPSESAETPMTSNVSVCASTATSTRHQATGIDNVSGLPTSSKGLQVCRTIEFVSTLLQKMTVACLELSELKGVAVSATVRITKEIKRNYLQLLALNHEDLRGLVDAFELEVDPRKLTALVSQDDEDTFEQNRLVERLQMRAPPPVRPVRQLSLADALEEEEEDDTRSFSPTSDDMKTTTAFYYPSGCHGDDKYVAPAEFDDLRRQIGSCDCEERHDGSEREGPETMERENLGDEVECNPREKVPKVAVQ